MNKNQKLIQSIIILFIGLFILPALQAQGDIGDRKAMMNERIKTQKIAFITSELNLTVDEAQAFWPVYNKYEEKRDQYKAQRGFTNIESEAQANKAIDQYLKDREDEHALNKAYILDLKSTLPSTKIFKLLQLERQFKEHLVKRVKQRMKRKNKGNRSDRN